MKVFTFVLMILFSTIGFGQESDTIIKRFDKLQLVPRIGLSYQKNICLEIGLSFNRYKIIYNRNEKYPQFTFESYGPYLSSEFLVRTDKTIIGTKIGYELNGLSSMMSCAYGFEITNFTDFNKTDIAFTPKIGLSFGYLEIFYGYNIFVNNSFLDYIGHHRFCVSMNINRLYWTKQKEMIKEFNDNAKNKK